MFRSTFPLKQATRDRFTNQFIDREDMVDRWDICEKSMKLDAEFRLGRNEVVC